MSDKNIKSRSCLANIELNCRIEFLENTLREKEEALDALQDSEKRYRRLFESARDGILILDAHTGVIVDVNPFMMQILGYSHDEFCGKHLWEIGAFKDITASKIAFDTLQNNNYIRYDDLPLKTSDGRIVDVEFVSNIYLVDHSQVIQCNIRDITQRKKTEAERSRFLSAIEQAGEMIVITDLDGIISYVNPAFERETGYSMDEAIGKNMRMLKSGKQSTDFYQNLWKTISGGSTFKGRMVNRRKDGTFFTEAATISPVRNPSGQIVNYVAVKRDITEHLQLEARFQQAQKMESVGRLAGGVAHDYNNMLSVIIGHTELALDKVDPSDPLHDDLNEIYRAAGRSTEITRQLLAFARKQTISPKVIDVNETVEGILKMIQRLIGEDIDLVWLPEEGLWPVKMDTAQIDQILANLCVNARDALSDVGKITIETHMVTIDEEYCAYNPGFIPGDFVMLAVSDDGCGMNKEVLDNIFEPFFTTKDLGKGTGLGLATVFGIIKQNNGFINVYSEPEIGTTFKIYLQRHVGEAVLKREADTDVIPPGRGETVFLLEDEPAILKIGHAILKSLGYKVLTANSADEALRLAKEYKDVIHLLITDVVMPGMNGRDLADQMHLLYPDLKTLFMSGYTSDVIAHRGVLEMGVNFLQKPFSIKGIAAKVREVLSAEQDR